MVDTDSFDHGGKRIRIVSGNIVDVVADAIVSSDDNYLTMGGGVSMAIRAAAGEEVYREARRLVPVPIGSAAVTAAGLLRARWLLHAIVIDHDTNRFPDVDIVRKATVSCLHEADNRGCRSMAMPALGTGFGRFA